MKLYQYLISILFISLLSADNQTAKDLLLKSFHRIDGIDHRFKIDSNEIGKKKKGKHFQVSVHWPADGNLLSQTRVTSILSKIEKPSSFWRHRYKDGTKAKKWMSLPITGKLKDVSDKKTRKKSFSFTDLGINEEDIRLHTHELLSLEKFNTMSAYVVELIMKNKRGKVRESKKLWIDVDSYIILRVEFYTRRGRLFRTVECSDFHYINKILFPMSIYVQDLKSKTDIQFTIKDIELNPEFNQDIFIPKDQ